MLMCSQESVFWYGMRLRGFSPGAQPKAGFYRRCDDPGTFGRRYWDLLAYDRQLSEGVGEGPW